MYVPSPGTTISLVTFPVVGSINSNGFVSSIGTIFCTPSTDTLPPKNCGNPFCKAPWMFVVSAGVAVGVAGNTVGVYLAVTGVPFLSTRLTVTPVPFPVNVFSGTNVTVPSGATV